MQLLAIDAGGTSTRAMVLDDAGRCLGIGRGGRGNPVSDGAEAAGAAISSAISGAYAAAGCSGADIAATTLAQAGGASRRDRDWLVPVIARAELTHQPRYEPDLLAMYASGTPALHGYGLVAGTGATAVRVAEGQVAGCVDGLGWLLGDTGSGFWIGHQVARAVAAHLDGGPSTSLTPGVLAALGVDEQEAADTLFRPAALNALVATVYEGSPLRLAQLAPLAFNDPHDDISLAIVSQATTALTEAVAGLARGQQPGPLVIGGGVAAQPRVHDAIVSALAPLGLNPVHLVTDGLVGAGVLALRRAGIVIDAAVHQNLCDSTDQHRPN